MKKQSHDNFAIAAVSFAVFLGGVVRFFPVSLSHFPLNDGGLFYSMAQDILDHNFSLPVFTSYNGNVIPFGYPPLPIYLMALFQRIFHFGLIYQLRFLPAFFSTLCIPAFYFLSKRITSSKEISVFAVFAYALMPQSYLWLIMGGGMARSLGVLFALLSILFVWKMFNNPKFQFLILSILFCSLVILCHPSIAWFVFMTSLLTGLFYGLNKKGILYGVLTILGVLLLTSPWWLTIALGNGVSLLVSTGQTGGIINLSILTFFFLSSSPFANIFSFLALFGLFAELARRRFFLFFWLILISILSVRSAESVVVIPGALLFGSGVVLLFIPGLLSNKKWARENIQTLLEIMQDGISKIAFSVILVFALFSAMATPLIGETEILALSQDDQEAMKWVAQNTTVNSQFAVLSGRKKWGLDPVSEWFPALSGRISVSTVQGSEWLTDHRYQKLNTGYNQLQSCSEQDYSCIISWAKNNDISFTYLFISKRYASDTNMNLPIIRSVKTDTRLQSVFDNPGVSIYKVVNNP